MHLSYNKYLQRLSLPTIKLEINIVLYNVLSNFQRVILKIHCTDVDVSRVNFKCKAWMCVQLLALINMCIAD